MASDADLLLQDIVHPNSLDLLVFDEQYGRPVCYLPIFSFAHLPQPDQTPLCHLLIGTFCHEQLAVPPRRMRIHPDLGDLTGF